jgi:tetratricopeptide (TPR) repeat protein
MKHRRVLAALLALFPITSSCGLTAHRATITEEKRIIKTYPFSDPDPVPILARRNAGIYPYFRFDGFSREGRDQEWKVVRLENDFIKVYVLPEVGGKIWGAVEKSTGRDFIYCNDVMKFRDVAMRGAWTSGGIEFNFGLIGHTPSAATPVDYALEKNADGSVSCIVGGMDLPSRTQWRVEIRLPKDSAEFETTSFWYNPTPLTQSYYHWMNAAVHARDDLQFYYPGQYYIGHGGDAHPWPVNEKGIDLSLYRNHNFGGHESLHVLGSYSDFSGGYWHDLQFGFGHWSEYDDMPGRKIWIWSQSRLGAIWEDLLTDHSGQYVEVQAGRQFSQAALSSGLDTPFTQAAFLPYAADTWKEIWFPVKQIGGIVAANPDGALNVSRNGDRIRIAFNALRPIRSDLTVTAGSTAVLRERLNMAPMQVYERETSIASAEQDITVALGGKLMWHSRPSSGEAFQRPVVSPPEKANTTTEKTFLLGRQQELLRDYDKALEYYSDCVKSDPLHVHAMVRLAEIYYRRAEYDRALYWAKKALSIDTYAPDANFVCGTVFKKVGNMNAAREALSWAARSPEYRTAAYTLIAEMDLIGARFEDAVEHGRRALDFNRYNIPALSAMAVALRKLGRRAEALRTESEILDIDALNHLAAAEAWFLDSSEQNRVKLTSFIRSELPQETYLELASYYTGIGLNQEAVRILQFAPSHPIVDYWLAYLTKDESPAESKGYLDKATQASPRLVFPFRDETIPVLQWALTQSRDWKTLYYAALIVWSKGRLEEAAGLLEECKNVPDFGPFYLARAELRRRAGQKPEIDDYRKAWELAPDEWRTWLALARQYSEQSFLDPARDTAKTGFAKFPENFMLGLEYAKALIDAKQFRAALDVLDRLVVLPYENASEGRVLYEKAHLLLAGEDIRNKKYEEALAHIAESKEWPEHLGVGKPYDPDERLQDVMERYCRDKSGERTGPSINSSALEKLRADLKRTSPWKYELLQRLKDGHPRVAATGVRAGRRRSRLPTVSANYCRSPTTKAANGDI